MSRWSAAFTITLLCMCVFARAPLGAQAQPTASSQWQFNDEDEQAPTWNETLRSQSVDLIVFGAFTALALVSFFRKDQRLKYVTLAACVALLGFWKSQLITIVNVFGLISLDLPIFRYSLAWYLLATFTVVSTVLWGRLYCGRMCAFGALTQLMDATLPASWRREPPAWLERRAAYVKYGLLVFAIVYFLVTRDRLIYRYIEPFWMFGFHGSALMWSLLAALLVATIFVRNLYCRFLCPVGAALGVISSVTTVFSIKRWKECNTCKICEKACEWGAIQGPKIIKSECVRCDDCERIYADEAKCVHWLIIKRKQDFAPSRGRA
jgi:NosR/NirI family transcriptional regulator, nitrous oxide reductase regulator